MSQGEIIPSTCLQANHRKEQFFNMKDAKHAKGIKAGFNFELTCGMLSRALFVNSCSIEVDILMRVPTHIIHKRNNMCAWYRNTSSIMTYLFLCTSPLMSIKYEINSW